MQFGDKALVYRKAEQLIIYTNDFPSFLVIPNHTRFLFITMFAPIDFV